jgi:putative hydrolase of the HAD superfamily
MGQEPIRAIFFDAGNTLIFPRLEELAHDLTTQGYHASIEDFFAAERWGKQKLDEWLWPQIRKGDVPRQIDHHYWSEYLRELMNRLQAPEQERPRLIGRVADGFRNIQIWSRVLPETAPYLASLRAHGYYVGVISNSVGTMEEQLARLGLLQYFDTVLDSAIVHVEKPHPEIFQIALKRAGVAGSEAIFVGDTYATDVGGAQLAGMRGVLMDHVNAYPNADCPRIAALPKLEQILEGS